MRGSDSRTGELFSYIDLEARVRQKHPLRAIRGIVNEALSALAGDFAALYSPIGRPSIPPEKLLRAIDAPRAAKPLGAHFRSLPNAILFLTAASRGLSH